MNLVISWYCLFIHYFYFYLRLLYFRLGWIHFHFHFFRFHYQLDCSRYLCSLDYRLINNVCLKSNYLQLKNFLLWKNQLSKSIYWEFLPSLFGHLRRENHLCKYILDLSKLSFNWQFLIRFMMLFFFLSFILIWLCKKSFNLCPALDLS